MEKKDWLFLALQLIIILMLAVVICNQIVMEDKIELHDGKIQTEIRDATFKLEGNMKFHVIPIVETVDNIANKMGVYSYCNDEGRGFVEEILGDLNTFKEDAKYWHVDPIKFDLREMLREAL